MKKSIVRMLSGLGMLWLFIMIGCRNKTDLTDLDPILKQGGSGIVLLSEHDARRMKHAFDLWFRNKALYDPSTTCNPHKPVQCDPNGNDGDVIIGTGGDDSLTQAVWMSKEVIHYLSKVLQDSSCDGVRIYFSACDTVDHDPYQNYRRQATIFMVPTDSVAASGDFQHKDNFGILDSIYSAYYFKKHQSYFHFSGKNPYFFTDGDGNALNHGELCPTQCTTPAGSTMSPK